MRTATMPDRQSYVSGLVSVIIPAHNAGEWIRESIGSAAAQTYAPVEIVVADDRSTDDTVRIAEALGAHVVRPVDSGPGAARNAALSAARGEFLQFLDADDVLAPSKVARQVRVLAGTGADVAWEPFHMLVPQLGGAGYAMGPRVHPEVGEDVAASLLSTQGFVQIGALLVRRTPRTIGIRFPEARQTVEDVQYAVELALRRAPFVSTDAGEPGLLYRQHHGLRYSGRPRPEFARACMATAAWAQAEWEREAGRDPGRGLTAVRRAALAEAYLFAARQLALVDDGAFREAVERLLGVDRSFVRRLPTALRWLTRAIGYTRAEVFAARWRRARASLHRLGVAPARERVA